MCEVLAISGHLIRNRGDSRVSISDVANIQHSSDNIIKWSNKYKAMPPSLPDTPDLFLRIRFLPSFSSLNLSKLSIVCHSVCA